MLTRPIPAMVMAILSRHGIAYQPVRGSKHRKLKAVLPKGIVTFTLAGSPSDRRAIRNQYNQTRRKLIAGGVQWQECKDLIR